MKKLSFIAAMLLCLGAFKCEPKTDPRNTCGPKVPLSECIK